MRYLMCVLLLAVSTGGCGLAKKPSVVKPKQNGVSEQIEEDLFAKAPVSQEKLDESAITDIVVNSNLPRNAPEAPPAFVGEIINIDISKEGDISFGGGTYTFGEMEQTLKNRAMRVPRDADHLPMIAVRIKAHPKTRYEVVQQLIARCMRAFI